MKYRILCIVFSSTLLAFGMQAHAQQTGCGAYTVDTTQRCYDYQGCSGTVTEVIPQGQPDGGYSNWGISCCGVIYPVFVPIGFCQTAAERAIDPRILQTLDQNLQQHGEHLLLADCSGNYRPIVASTINAASPAELNFSKRLVRMAGR